MVSIDSVKTVLVVEDDPLLLKAIKLTLLGEGFEVITASNGIDALDKLKTEPIHLLLLDLLLPLMGGDEILDELRDRPEFQELPIIIFSNYPPEEKLADTTGLNAKHYVIKSSVDLNDLVEIIRKTIEEQDE